MQNPPETTISSPLDDLPLVVPLLKNIVKMKVAVLLALVGLASCRLALIGGDRAKDVTIKYSYLDENGRIVEVEVDADRLGLQLAPVVQAQPPAPTPAAVRYFQAAAPAQPTPVLTKRLLQVAPAPVVAAPRFAPVAPVAPVTQTQVVTRYVQVAAAPAPTPAPRYVKVDLDDDDDDEVRRVYRPAKVVAPVVVSTVRASPLAASRRRASDDDDSAED